jgi:hypothetical protein
MDTKSSPFSSPIVTICHHHQGISPLVQHQSDSKLFCFFAILLSSLYFAMIVSPMGGVFFQKFKSRLSESGSRFFKRISSRIRSQNRNGSKGSVREEPVYAKTSENPPHCHVPLTFCDAALRQVTTQYCKM